MLANRFQRILAFAIALAGVTLIAQDQAPPPESENWNLFFQATSIGQYHGTFHSPYSGPFSLQDYPERDVSLTTTLFFGLRLAAKHLFLFRSGNCRRTRLQRRQRPREFLERRTSARRLRHPQALPRASLRLPRFRLRRRNRNRWTATKISLPGKRPVNRYTITAGRFTVTDFFDNNRYSHDPRTQFMGWAVMYNGAWDYPADVRGYTWGWVHELHTRNWSFRYASAAMPRVANGLRFDRRLFVNRGDMFEGEYRYALRKHPGVIRLLNYENHANAGTYAEAIRQAELTGGTPSVVATRRNGTLKYGFGVNLEQELTKDIGVFARLGWNDGKTESFAFTAIDRLATGGVSITGRSWHRPFDTVATEFTASGLSGVHALYLARGGDDFLIGDGHLGYAPECIEETYYNARLFPGFFASFDLQHVANPAFNRSADPYGLSRSGCTWNSERTSSPAISALVGQGRAPPLIRRYRRKRRTAKPQTQHRHVSGSGREERPAAHSHYARQGRQEA